LADSGRPPTVSVVIPCYNLGAYLDQAVQSVLDQTFTDLEILVVDDGSTDEATRHLFVSYRRPKTRIIRTENRGPAAARNRGLREARASYLCFLDADDLLEPTFLDKAVAVLEEDPRLGFASCWLRAFGDASYRWSPLSCDFPVLLAECTVCTAALQRREAVLAAGGYDEAMALQGYEDWDLAIGLVERGWPGTIIPEYLFRYRIRGGSLSQDRGSPEQHSSLMRYLMTKHHNSYRKHLAAVLEITEQRTRELETQDRAGSAPTPGPALATIPDRDRMLRAIGRDPAANSCSPTLSIVVACCDDGNALLTTLASLEGRVSTEAEVLVADDGSTDPSTLDVLDACSACGVRVLRMEGRGLPAALRDGVQTTSGAWVLGLAAGDTLLTALPSRNPSLSIPDAVDFVIGGLQNGPGNGHVWTPESPDLPGLIGCPRLHFPLTSREHLMAIGGYDGRLPTVEDADWDLAVRLGRAGLRGLVVSDPLVRRSALPTVTPQAPSDEACSTARARWNGDRPKLLKALFGNHHAVLEELGTELFLRREDHRRRLEATVQARAPSARRPSRGGPVDWGSLRRLEPISAEWGFDRGKPVDRHYIEGFLERHRGDIRGRVLEVKDPFYTSAFGTAVESCDILDVAPENPLATLVGDLSVDATLPARSFDCFVLTQTIHIIYHIRRVIRNAHRTLKPGGVLLATLPCASRIDYESGVDGDSWRFTTASARRLFEESFGEGSVDVQAFGNVLTCCAFLMGVAAEELTPEELAHQDPYFPLLIGVRAVRRDPRLAFNELRKDPPPTLRARPAAGRAGLLVYHRIDRARRDRWGLSVSPENFAAHLRILSRRYECVRVPELAALLGRGTDLRGIVGVTFDDGYRDNFTTALPLLKEWGVPATFFITGGGAPDESTFWWDRFEAAVQSVKMDEQEVQELHERLMTMAPGERGVLLDQLRAPAAVLPSRLTREELRAMAVEALVEIGSHTLSHRALSSLSADEQRTEIHQNVRMLAQATGRPITSFAYPFGHFFSEQTVEIVREAGIVAACTVEDAAVTSMSDPFRLPRMQVGNWNADDFDRRLGQLLDD
jgi:glycosyltransferase involved in cell wall biosynthesis/peptidoglycan/xylan/chitin deacetylase (PgdA/CDA1 family)